ncbi:MAG: peptidase S9, partial [Duncaniella sp.]|nr:peptidase S9 [Duncaniella sp.]
MNLRNMLLCAGAAAGMMACTDAKTDEGPIIEKPDFHSSTGIFDIDALEALGRVSAVQVSPDGSRVLFGISYESVEQNKSNADLYTMAPDGSDLKRITRTASSEGNFCWIDGGKRIAFTYPVDGKPQVFVMEADGSGRKQVSDVEKGVEGFLFSPDGSKVLIVSTVKYSRDAADLYPDLPKATGRVIDDMMYKHWDEWVTEIPHPFIGSFDGNKIGDLEDIMADELRFESPMKPFGGIESFAWAPDSKSLVYTSRKKEGMAYAVSTNSDLYLYNIEEKSTRNLTEGMMGYDTNPAFSPDGSTLAWLSMERDGYESDRNRLFVLDMATKEKYELPGNWDYHIDEFAWAPDGKSVFFIAPKDGVIPVFEVAMERGAAPVQIVDQMADFTSLQITPDYVVTMMHSMLRPNEVMTIARNPRA